MGSFRQPRRLAGVVALLLLACAAQAHWGPPPENYRRMTEIATSDQMGKEEKILALRAFLVLEPAEQVLRIMVGVDRNAGQRVALEIFRAPGTSRATKLSVAHLLLIDLKVPGFMAEYGPFLIEGVLKGGEAEFMTPQTTHTPTAVGHYAFLASGFERFPADQFDKVRDARVIPILIKGLEAPDWLARGGPGAELAEAVPPGQPTGRNVQRQQLPVALARLGAKEAVPALKRVIFTHHDHYLGNNAAYAVGVLADGPDWREVEGFLLQPEKKAPSRATWNDALLFSLGKGILERGDDAGVRYMALRYSVEMSDARADRSTPITVLRITSEHLKAMRGVRSPKAQTLYLDLLQYEPLRRVFSFDPAKLPEPKGLEQTGAQFFAGQRNRILQAWRDLLDGIVDNRCVSLAAPLLEAARESKEPEVRRLADEAVYHLQTAQPGAAK